MKKKRLKIFYIVALLLALTALSVRMIRRVVKSPRRTVASEARTNEAGEGGNTIVIGSKNFTEQIILGEIMAQLVENRTNLNVERKFNLGGTLVCFEGLKKGELDLYVEYTGTGLMVQLKRDSISDPEKVYDVVKDEFKNKWDLVWLKPPGFNNTYTMTIRKEDYDNLGIKKISDLKKVADTFRPGFNNEFIVRKDGYPGLIKHYGFKFKAEPAEMDSGLMYRAIAAKEVDVISGFATDGRIPAFNLVILKDDLHFFPPYYAAPLVRADTLEANPGLRDVLNLLAGKISDETMQRLNYEVDEEKRLPREVARDFLMSVNAIGRRGNK